MWVYAFDELKAEQMSCHRRPDIPEGLDELLTVLFSAVGIWQFTHQLLLAVPVAVYLSRGLYKVTGSVWVGAFTTGLLLGRSSVGPADQIISHAPGWFSESFHI